MPTPSDSGAGLRTFMPGPHRATPPDFERVVRTLTNKDLDDELARGGADLEYALALRVERLRRIETERYP